MVLNGFEAYSLQAWRDESGLIIKRNLASSFAQGKKSAVKRKGNWNVGMFAIAGTAYLAVSSLLATDPSALALPNPSNSSYIRSNAKPISVSQSSIDHVRELNRSFNNFFNSVREGSSLIPSGEIRELARKAIISQKSPTDIDVWASSLANDIKSAKD